MKVLKAKPMSVLFLFVSFVNFVVMRPFGFWIDHVMSYRNTLGLVRQRFQLEGGFWHIQNTNKSIRLVG